MVCRLAPSRRLWRRAVLTSESALEWLKGLREQIPNLPLDSEQKLYWSQRLEPSSVSPKLDLAATVRECRAVVDDLDSQFWFADTLGFDCVDSYGRAALSIADWLGQKVGKAHLGGLPDGDWSEDDLCDYIEVLHDISARPTTRWYHEFSGCGWHPDNFDRASGAAIFRWSINRVLDKSSLGLRIATEGGDIGRVTKVMPNGLEDIVAAAAEINVAIKTDVSHAITMFRQHGASREDRRMAVVELAGVLEANRTLLKKNLLTKDESALFQIANKFDLRHRDVDQQSDYADEYLDWLFHWYLATVELIRQLSER